MRFHTTTFLLGLTALGSVSGVAWQEGQKTLTAREARVIDTINARPGTAGELTLREARFVPGRVPPPDAGR